MPSDLEIAQKAKLHDISDVAAKAGIDGAELELYGNTKAKVKLSVLDPATVMPKWLAASQ